MRDTPHQAESDPFALSKYSILKQSNWHTGALHIGTVAALLNA